ncbi:hypothetical protein [Streptomyces anulatus]|uniref:hypothetical protein n=1 Tax=Streptomyces anulatus TaxID=1892 RepID=UPI0016799928|nr:hypothetical protein [Streptomyces anulatus]GGY78643.1 hypothetical protein GCM10010342_77680 [Streptomyces anulatus]
MAFQDHLSAPAVDSGVEQHRGAGRAEEVGGFAEEDGGLGGGCCLGAVVLCAVPGGGCLDRFDEGEQEVEDGGCAAAAGCSGCVFQGAGGGLEAGAGGAVEGAGAGGAGGLLEGGGRGADLVADGGRGDGGGDGEEVAEGGDVARTLGASGTRQESRYFADAAGRGKPRSAFL